MLELLWVCDSAAARSDLVSRTQLWDRWEGRRRGACPFGICMRLNDGERAIPFPPWEFRPPYLPPSASFYLAEESPLSEPMWVVMDFGPGSGPAPQRVEQPLDHPIGFREVTAIRLTTPTVQRSAAATAVAEAGIVSFTPGPEYRIDLEFDSSRWGKPADFRPALPLIIC